MQVVYEELVDFIAAGATPQQVADFQPSEATKAKVFELIRREKSSGITADEKAELDYYLLLEHLMRMAKARARQRLGAA